MSVTRSHDGDDVRWYEVEVDGETIRALSVTQILSLALEEDQTGLEIWRGRNDGTDDAPYWQHLFWYSAPRGTLCHYQALCEFEEHFDEDDMWGEEEGESMRQIVNGPAEEVVNQWNQETDHEVPGDLNEITYSVLKDQGIVDSRTQYDMLFADSTTLADVLRDDVDFFLDKFDLIRTKLGVDDDDVLNVEKKLLNTEDRYGGQCDLVYEDVGGNVVLADLKTSSGLRQKHRLQSVAYMKAVEKADWGPDEIDRLEVWRIAPSKRSFEVHANEVPPHAEEYDWYTDDNWFVDPYGDFEYDDLEDMWDTFTQLSEVAHDDVSDEA